MPKQNVEIRFVDTWPKEEIVTLYKAGGWWKESWSSSGIDPMIKGSFAFAVVVDSSSCKAIGMGRIISDGVSDAYIQDLVVLPEYRGLYIGKRLLAALLHHCLSKGIQWIGLIAEPGNENFFSKQGFKPKSNHTPMLYESKG
ncbi:MAG: GNAT family N-acetyltransferase [Thermoplasmatales archaeon]|nr:MAG: GNAT family N-acetyltransferase [Thermoplasmatales archaeon]